MMVIDRKGARKRWWCRKHGVLHKLSGCPKCGTGRVRVKETDPDWVRYREILACRDAFAAERERRERCS